MDVQSLIIVALAFAAGGFLKGVIGAGAPLLAVPLMTVMVDVQFAVAVFALGNIVPNLWQVWHFRKAKLARGFVVRLAVAGGIGAGLGTILLAALPSQVLVACIAAVLVMYVGFRVLNPAWRLPFETGQRLVIPVGLVAGAMQGATGLSAPVSMTYLSALRLERSQFILAVSGFFIALGVVQIPVQAWFGIMTWERLGLSALAQIPLFAAMPVGMFIGQRLPREVFDRLLLVVLAALAVRMVWGVIAG